MSPHLPITKTIGLAALAMVAFAANSILCRLALGQGTIDPVSFTILRLGSGALILTLLVILSGPRTSPARPDWPAALALATYMTAFSFAYLSLDAGTGALILFGAVQLAMFTASLRAGEVVGTSGWVGLGLALCGLVFLLAPGARTPAPLGVALMTVAGIAWGVYSVRGRATLDPLRATATAFVIAWPVTAIVCLPFRGDLEARAVGIALAIAAGGLASALGYVIWYRALRGLDASQAATIQLTVPVLAAFGGVVVLAEPVNARLLGAAAAVLGGVALMLTHRRASTGRDARRWPSRGGRQVPGGLHSNYDHEVSHQVSNQASRRRVWAEKAHCYTRDCRCIDENSR